MANAATKTSLCQHGGAIDGGSTNVIIGSFGAARIGDNHKCPQVTAGVPHQGGPINAGLQTVKINDMAAARVGDTLVCTGTGEVDTITQGNPTVQIG